MIDARAGDYAIRQLRGEDAEAFRELHLEALATHPDAFALAYEEQCDLPLEDMRASLGRLAIFGGFVNGRLAALATLQRQSLLKRRHVAMISGMYVSEPLRGTGLATDIMKIVLDHARTEVDQVELYVAVDNVRASKFYKRFGFERYGVMRRSLRVHGIDHDAEMLVLMFR